MGQGYYWLIGFGSAVDASDPDEKRRIRAHRDELLETLEVLAGVRLQTEQEAPPYLVIPLAASDQVAGVRSQDRVRMDELNVLPLDTLIAVWRERIGAERTARAEAAWLVIQEEVKKRTGYMLPDGQMLFITDWD